MILKELKPRKALNKAFLKVKPNRTEIEGFKTNLTTLLDRTNDTESEEFHKNLVSDFLKDTYYKQNHFINTKGRNDLVIHNGQNANSTVGVILEAKKPTNKSEMITTKKLNAKAFQELVLYYLRERITHKNLEVKHLVATNINEWFIFDATLFDRLFAQNKNLVKQFIDFEEGRLADTKTDFFYRQIAEPFIADINQEIEFTYFNIQDYTPLLSSLEGGRRVLAGGVSKHLPNPPQGGNDNSLIALFKLLSPEHLLKLPFTNDSNSLDKRFYSELLHIIGLTETKEGSKKLIERNKAGERHSGTILEDTIIQLDSLDKLSRLERPSQYGSTSQERLFNVALELSITWINRILFLKLLEAQLITYHKTPLLRGVGGVSPLLRGVGGVSEYKFLNLDKIKNYDDLNSLFFQVLARKYDERNEDVKKIFEKVPYLNSSLFEPTDIEQVTLFISNLKDDKTIPIFSQTVLKDQQGKKRTGNLTTLQYLLEFLDAYDFGAEGSEEIQEDNKTLINASVLGLIFEKINGYKDGSFFTPGFITMYMCRETIRKAVVQKFNEAAATLLSSLEGGRRVLVGGVSPLLRGDGGVSKKREIIPYNPKLTALARELRNNSTKSEIILWKELKGKFDGKYDFHRQKPLDNYIADFYCHELKLVIEIDGETHNWEETQVKDFQKECRLNELGINVLRFPDSDIFNHLESTYDTIKLYIEGFEKGDLSSFVYEDTPLNPLSRGDFALPEPIIQQRFNAFKSLNDVYEQIGDDRLFSRQEANNIVNSIKICDPAVGSGHFLVSALNEMIAVKNDLKILQDRDGKRLKEYQVEVVNDELIVTDEEGELFEYKVNTPLNPLSRGDFKVSESQRIQETLFHEKQTIIENCLFGVDINSNSVKICRLRLWIELLKNAYYKHLPDPPQGGNTPLSRGVGGVTPLLRGVGGVLETLPNIDINIKCGNSLVSRFAIDSDLSQALKKSKWTIDSYRIAVDTYRNAESKEQKREMERLIADIKSDFRSEISLNDPKVKKLRKLSGDLFQLTNQTQLFEMGKKEKADWNKKVTQLTEEAKKLEAEIEEIKANKIFENAFEWRFEFPEVLNDDGDFVGFDVVIGNPPYIRQEEVKDLSGYFQSKFKSFSGKSDIYVFFYENSINLLKPYGAINFITSGKFFEASYGKPLIEFLLNNTEVIEIINFNDLPVFEGATAYPLIYFAIKKSKDDYQFNYYSLNELPTFSLKEKLNSIELLSTSKSIFTLNDFKFVDNRISNIIEKVKIGTVPIKDFCGLPIVGVKTGFNEGFLTDLKDDKIVKPYVFGRDIKKYSPIKPTNKIIFPYNDDYSIADIKDYPEISSHLEKQKAKLSQRAIIKDGLVSKTKCWYEYQQINKTVDYNAEYIIYPNVSLGNNFTLTKGAVIDMTGFLIKSNSRYLLAILNSKLIAFLMNIWSISRRGGYLEYKVQYIEKIPIKNISEKEQKPFIELVEKILEGRKNEKDTTDLESQIDQLVYQLYDLTKEEIKIIENS